MKKMKTKRLFAVLLTLAMVLGMAAVSVADPKNVTTASAGEVPLDAGTERSDADVAPVSVKNVVSGAAVRAYRVVKADYTDGKFTGYSAVPVSDGAVFPDATSPSAVDVANIANIIAASSEEQLDAWGVSRSALFTQGAANGEGLAEYTCTLSAGYWIVLVTNSGDTIYNPMLLGVYYQNKNGGIDTVSGGAIDASRPWFLHGQDGYAKSDKPEFNKKILGSTASGGAIDNTDALLNGYGNDVAIGDTVKFGITAQIPAYDRNTYKEVSVSISDTVSGSGLKILRNSIQVHVGTTTNGAIVEPGDTTFELKYKPEGENNEIKEFTIDFKSSYALDEAGHYVYVTYDAVLDENEAKINFDPNTNKATFEYSNNPSNKDDKVTREEETHTYTFAIDSTISGQITDSWITRELLKVGEDEMITVDVASGSSIVAASKAALTGAEFTLTNTSTQAIYTTSSVNGDLKFEGLDAGNYLLKETKAPEGYSLNDVEIPVVITANYNPNGTLKDYQITINGKVTSTYTATYSQDNPTKITVIDKGVGNGTFEIMNTKLTNLPSTGGIGTTIFTIAGCLIMILAAALFFASRRKSSKK